MLYIRWSMKMLTIKCNVRSEHILVISQVLSLAGVSPLFHLLY